MARFWLFLETFWKTTETFGKIMEKENEFVRTTVYIQRRLLESAKMMAILTRTNVSQLMRIALKEKIEKLKNKKRDCEN